MSSRPAEGKCEADDAAAASSSSSSSSSDSQSVQVVVRVRPLNSAERAAGSPLIVAMTKSSVTVTEPSSIGAKLAKPMTRTFNFDRCFFSAEPGAPGFATQATVHSELGTSLAANALSGFNSSIFAYGQTGSGKTYTMLGADTRGAADPADRSDDGLIPNM